MLHAALVRSLLPLALTACQSTPLEVQEAPGAARGGSTARPHRPEDGALEIGDPYFPGLGNGGYDVEHYDLELDLDMASDTFGAKATIRARALQDLASF